MRILIVAPHSDDETIGCGGMISKASGRGDDVYVVTVALGYGDTRYEELLKAADVLGARDTKVLYWDKDSCLDTIPQRELVSRFDEVLSEPYDEVYIPYNHFHQDHRAVFDACLSSLRVGLRHTPGLVAMYETVFPAWSTFSAWHGKMYVDITNTINRKTDALFCHKSQLNRSARYPLSIDAVRTLARERGMECGVEYAEMFYVLREMR
jgi:LmbE family N-acetylglucosaminyl deacetylase